MTDFINYAMHKQAKNMKEGNSLSLSLSPFKRPFSRWIWVSRYQNVSILDFIGAKDDGGGVDN